MLDVQPHITRVVPMGNVQLELHARRLRETLRGHRTTKASGDGQRVHVLCTQACAHHDLTRCARPWHLDACELESMQSGPGRELVRPTTGQQSNVCFDA